MSLTRPVSCVSDFFSSYRFLFLIDLLELLFFDELYLFDDDYEHDGSGSGSPGMCDFPFFYRKSVGSVSGVGSEVFVPTGIKSIGDVVLLVVFVPRGVDSKRGRIIELFWRPKY